MADIVQLPFVTSKYVSTSPWRLRQW